MAFTGEPHFALTVLGISRAGDPWGPNSTMAFFTESPFGSITSNGMPNTSCLPHLGNIKRSWSPPEKRLFVLTADATLSRGKVRYFETTGIGGSLVMVANTVS